VAGNYVAKHRSPLSGTPPWVVDGFAAVSLMQGPDPEVFQRLAAVSTLVSTEVFDEVHDLRLGRV
jgi:hypothetical protein